MTHNAFFAQRKKAGMMLLSLLLLLSVVLAACGGSNSTTTHNRPLHPNSLTLLANEQDAYTQNFNPYNTARVISGTQGFIYETLLYVNRLDGRVKPWLASVYDLPSDAQNITFHLRQPVTCSDAQPLPTTNVT